MHIPDGVLAAPVLVAGGVGAAVALGLTLRSVSESELPKVAVVSAMFFVVSLINVPIGPTSVHLVLSGLMGLVLGRATVPAVFIGLILQAVFFGFGGLTALGITTLNIALPGVLWAMLLGPAIAQRRSALATVVLGGLVGLLSIVSSALLVIAALAASDPAYLAAAPLMLVPYIPLALAEALITGFAVGFLARVKPDALAPRQMVGSMFRIALIAVLVILGSAAPALAHKLKVFATVVGTTVEGRAYFVGGGPALDVPVTMTDVTGTTVGATTTAAPAGTFTLAVPFRADLTITADARDGHVATFALAASRLAESLPPAPERAGADVPAAPEPASATGATSSVPLDAIEAAVARQVGPLADEIDELQASIGFRDLLGGIGIVFGIFGLWALLKRKPTA